MARAFLVPLLVFVLMVMPLGSHQQRWLLVIALLPGHRHEHQRRNVAFLTVGSVLSRSSRSVSMFQILSIGALIVMSFVNFPIVLFH
jgi:hypothetical protein